MPEPIANRVCLEELKKSAEEKNYLLKNLSAMRLRGTFQKISEEADKHYKDNNKEDAYILYMRLMMCYKKITETSEYKEDSRFYQVMYGQPCQNAVNRLEELDKYFRRIEKLSQDQKPKPSQEPSPVSNKSSEKLPEKNGSCPFIKNGHAEIAPLAKKTDPFITPKDLFEMMKTAAPNSLLILDIRLKEDFDNSSFKAKDVCVINIPSSLLQRGFIASKLENNIEEKYKPYFKKRSEYDKMVIIDWFGDDEFANALLNKLTKWDVNTTYKSTPVRLTGGYDAWLSCYPFHTTNSNVKVPEKQRNERKIVLDDISYPTHELFNIDRVENKPAATLTVQQDVAKPTFDRKTKPVINDKKIDANNVDLNEKSDVTESIDRKVAPLDGPTRKEEGSESSVIENNKKEKQISVESDDEEERKKQYCRAGRRPALTSPADHIVTDNNNFSNDSDEDDLSESYRNENSEDRVILRNRNLEAESGMKRCSSTPNISKIENSEYSRPHIDRSLKPSSNDDQFNSFTVGNSYYKERRGLIGLLNVGNTCYMNSIIQCLSNTTHLRHFLFKLEYNGMNPKSKTRGRIAKEVSNIIKQLWSKDSGAVSCKSLKNIVGEYRDSFKGSEQQDSHEFLTILIDWLHEDLNEPRRDQILNGADEKSGEKAWGEFTSKNNSKIRELFYGQQKSTVSCRVCEKESVTFEPFSNLSLPIPSAEKCTLGECLNLYIRDESVSGWQCPNCKCSRTATKKLDITKLPPFLVIHFKRFTSDGWCRKRLTHVDFPNMLDMTQYIIGQEHRNRKFKLYAVSNHIGSMETGHYTAFCYNSTDNGWYKYDDENVTSMSDVARSSQAYIVFYQSIQEF